ncbi:unnamed protein product [Orchesella dallaii]|uniref:Uncharacterized protein n=1 Tax=Orchesella dallaii TaxID=48710 RepID=A0ABP1Q964_9HEXA
MDANQDANENTEFNLKAVLTMHVDEFKHADHDFYNYEPECYTSSVPNQEIEVLFCRDDLKSRLEKRKLSSHQSPSLPDSCQVDEQNDTQFDDQHTATSTSNKGLQPHSSLTQNVNYKSFMEETMFIKCCSKEVLQLLENIKNVVGQKIGIRNDSSFGHVLTVQAWIWILKETALISSLATKNDKTRHKSMNCFMSKIFSTIDGSFKQLHSEMRNLLKIYEKVESEFKSLNEKSQHRFENNVAGASEYERNTSGCSFFQHHYSQYDSNESSFVDFGMVSTKSLMKKPQKTLSEGVTSRGMKVRWNVDGVTVRSTETGCKWLKFLSVNQDKDKIIIMKIFANALSEAYHDGRKYKVIARKILHRSHHLEHIFSKGSLTPSSILESVFKCKSILDKSRKAINLLPKEEVIMLYSLKSAMAAFSLIKPTLIDAILATEELNKICSELSSQRKKLQSGDIGSRIPLERHAYFEMEIEDTKINVDIMYENDKFSFFKSYSSQNYA